MIVRKRPNSCQSDGLHALHREGRQCDVLSGQPGQVGDGQVIVAETPACLTGQHMAEGNVGLVADQMGRTAWLISPWSRHWARSSVMSTRALCSSNGSSSCLPGLSAPRATI